MDLVKNCKIIDFNIIYTLNICLSKKKKGLICSVYLVLRYYFSLTVKTHVHNPMHLVELLFFLYLISVCSRIFLYPKTCVYKYDVITTYNEFSFFIIYDLYTDDLSNNKVATQLHTYPGNMYAASLAVDRDATTCMRTYSIGPNSLYKTVLWKVDLGGVYSIYSINILFKNYDGFGT